MLISYCKWAIINVPQSHTKDTVSDILVARIIKSNFFKNSSSNPHCNYRNFTIFFLIWVSLHTFFYLLIPTEENNMILGGGNVYMMPVVGLSIKCKLWLESKQWKIWSYNDTYNSMTILTTVKNMPTQCNYSVKYADNLTLTTVWNIYKCKLNYCIK